MMKRMQLMATTTIVGVLAIGVSMATAQQRGGGAGDNDQPQGRMHQMHGQHGGGGMGQGMGGQGMGRMMQCPHCGMAMGKSASQQISQAKAVLIPTEGNDVTGTVTFEQEGPLLVINAEVRGLEPGSTHGFHIHEYGDISAPDGTAAGGHYNPEDTPHALPHDPERHAGDLGNITANDQGVATATIKVRNASLSGTNPVLGRAVIVHAKEDTGAQPTGEAGARLAQGVIGVDTAE